MPPIQRPPLRMWQRQRTRPVWIVAVKSKTQSQAAAAAAPTQSVKTYVERCHKTRAPKPQLSHTALGSTPRHSCRGVATTQSWKEGAPSRRSTQCQPAVTAPGRTSSRAAPPPRRRPPPPRCSGGCTACAPPRLRATAQPRCFARCCSCRAQTRRTRPGGPCQGGWQGCRCSQAAPQRRQSGLRTALRCRRLPL